MKRIKVMDSGTDYLKEKIIPMKFKFSKKQL